jgi:hypothetical protein
MHRRLELSLSREVLNSASDLKDAINARFALCNCPVVIHSHVLTENWRQRGAELLDFFLEFWQGWPELSVDQRLLVFLFIKYQVRSHGWYKDWQLRQANAEIRKRLGNYDFGRFDRLRATLLPELQGPTLNEAQDWARSEHTSKYCDAYPLVSAIADYYVEWEARQRPKSRPIRIPMEQLAVKLRQLMLETSLQRVV